MNSKTKLERIPHGYSCIYLYKIIDYNKKYSLYKYGRTDEINRRQ